MQALRVSKNQLIVTTDDDKILRLSKKYKKLFLVKRPKALSKSNSSSIDVIRHVLKKFKDEDKVVLLQPTSPLEKI